MIGLDHISDGGLVWKQYGGQSGGHELKICITKVYSVEFWTFWRDLWQDVW